jgi:hypothetical protein
MADLETLERRMDELERRLDLMSRQGTPATDAPRRTHGASGRVVIGALFLILGLIWLGKNFGLDWLQQIEFWPIAVIAIGLFIIFGERGR